MVLVLPLLVAVTGIAVIKHDCSSCHHSDVDFFMIDECCETGNHSSCCADESHAHESSCCETEEPVHSSCCGSNAGMSEAFHKCRHTVYEFSYTTTFTPAKILSTFFAPAALILIDRPFLLLTQLTSPFNHFRPPPLFLTQCNFRI